MAKKATTVKKSTSKAEQDAAQLIKENNKLKAQLANLQEENKSTNTKRIRSIWRPTFAIICVAFAIVAITLANISFWVRDTVVDTDQFVSTMQPLIKDPAIQKTIQTQVTDEIFKQVNIEEELKNVLPDNIDFISGPFAGQVKSFTYDKIGEALNSQKVYDVWTQALTTSHSTIIAYIEDPNNSGVITVNSVYKTASEKLGDDSSISFLLNKTLPDKVGTIQLANIEGVPKAREALNVLNKTTIALALASVLFVVAAIALSTRRRTMVITLSALSLLLMLSTVAALSIGSSQVASNTEQQFSAAAQAAYDIITAPLVAQTQGVAALLAAVLLIAIIGSSWSAMVWLRKKMRQSLDYINKKIIGTWKGANWLNWIEANQVVVCWTLVVVSFAAFALRLPPTVSGVKEALTISLLAVLILEILVSVSRVSKK